MDDSDEVEDDSSSSQSDWEEVPTLGSPLSKSESQDEDEDCQIINVLPSTSKKPSFHVSVQREEISAATIREENDDDDGLQELDIDVYDQQTYEKSVFDQVDRALTDADHDRRKKPGDASDRSKINDLMRVIHGDGKEAKQAEDLEATPPDGEVLQLVRQTRINQEIKKERLEKAYQDFQVNSLPRVPKLKRTTPADESKEAILEPSSSGQPASLCKIEPFAHQDRFEEVPSDSDNSEASEFIPAAGEDSEDDYDDRIDYQSDSEVEQSSEIQDAEGTSSRDKKIKDDGDFKAYSRRLKSYIKSRAKLRFDNILDDGTEFKKLDEMVTIDGNLQILKEVWDNLYEHQKTGVRWLWELHQLGTGGILGDEMGLGKTIQMIAFLTALKCSSVVNSHNHYENLGPVVLVCPATVMHQWLVEFRKWYPPFRVAILHSTGTFSGDRRQLIRVIHKSNGILICSFPGVVIYQDYLHTLDWHYAILDEGHKIKNPDAQVTLACKRFRTPHRLILSGSPVQNNLRELWSIFDYIYPGKLGTLPVFMGQFGIPITQGGYANATDIQVQIAYKCACILRDTIKPFLLRRTKAEVNNKLKLPDRSEQVLFCKLTEKQRRLYESYLTSPTVRDIRRGLCQIFVGLVQMRKICNHPDLFDATECTRQVRQKKKQDEDQLRNPEFFSTDETFGHYSKSGKMMVVHALLKLWKKQGHKVLLFTQSRQMLKIFMNYCKETNYKYLSMDGATPIGVRHSLIDSFNNNEEIFIFLLTTRVGGVGVNLIGANRIIIYDPDWNPSTDIQARERAWRIGQTRHVIIYRLLTAGTIEEKIYHRQVFKLYLTNRILKDAKQKRFFKTNDMHELFTLGHDDKNIETKALFDDDFHIDERTLKKKKSKKRRKKSGESKRRRVSSDENSPEPNSKAFALSEEKIREMRERAKKLSLMISLQYGNQSGQPQGQVKVERLETGPDGQSSSRCRIQEIKSEPSDVTARPFSPTQPVPYQPACPAGSSFEALVDNSSSVEKVKLKRSSKKRVDYLVKQIAHKSAKGSKSDDDSNYQRDDYILGRLFKNSNIAGALKHDRIEGDSTADFKVVESEAEKVARDAIRVLRESRRMCLSSTSGIPNWTGRHGQVAARPRLMPKNKARAQQIVEGRSSARPESQDDSLLSSIRKRNQKNPIPLRRNDEGDSASDEEERNRDFDGKAKDSGADNMAEKIRTYLLHQTAIRGEAQTEELLEFFKRSFSPDKTSLFKAILYKLCEMQRRDRKGFWKLKQEFRDMM